jgi:hypothetical protein
MSTPSTQLTPLTPSQINAAQSEQWKAALRQAVVDLRVAVPGIIQSFDAVGQTATVQIAIREQVRTNSGPDDVTVAPIYKVPVVLPRAGGFSLTLPMKAGDECLLVFADASFDLWWQRGGVQNQFEIRRHDVTDCFCIPGPWNQQRLLSNYSTTSAQLRSDDGTVIIDVAETGITVTAPKVIVNSSGSLGLFGLPISITELPVYANNALAVAGGLLPGNLYQNGSGGASAVCIVT